MSKRKLNRIVFLILLLILGFAVQVTPGSAQVTPTLAVEPSTIEVPQGNRVQLELEVNDGADVNAFDIMINYDRDRLSLYNWEHGDYLSNLSCTHLIRQPGVLELACNQVSQPEVDGDGVLLILIFDTIGIGFPDVTITEAVFFDFQGDITYPERQHGVVEVTNAATHTSTATNTRIPTQTPSPLPTSTSTITPFLSPTPESALTEPADLEKTASVDPGVVTVTATLTKTPGGLTPTVTSTQIPTDIPQPGETQTPTPTIPGEEEGSIDDEIGELKPSRSQTLIKNLWRVTLWGGLIFVGVTVLGMIIYLVWKRIKKGDEEDLLL